MKSFRELISGIPSKRALEDAAVSTKNNLQTGKLVREEQTAETNCTMLISKSQQDLWIFVKSSF